MPGHQHLVLGVVRRVLTMLKDKELRRLPATKHGGAAVNASPTAPAADPWGTPSSNGPAPAVTNSSDSWGAVQTEPAPTAAPAQGQSDAWGSQPAAPQGKR